MIRIIGCFDPNFVTGILGHFCIKLEGQIVKGRQHFLYEFNRGGWPMRTQQYNVIGHFYGMVQHALISILSYKKDLTVPSSREKRVKNMLLHSIPSDLGGKK